MSEDYRDLLISVLAIVFLFDACDGPEGRTGPQGIQGPQGEQGPQGPPGEDGEDGTANVIYSEWMDINWNISDGTNIKQMLISEPRITEEFTDMGTLLMYARNATLEVNIAIALPFLQGNDYLYFYALSGHDTLNDGIVFIAESVDYSTPVNEFSNTEIRYVLIPDGVPAKMSANFFEDYEAVAEYYGISD
jgi:hypothetical protein